LAQCYDNITSADADAQARLNELEEDGLMDDTIVFFIAPCLFRPLSSRGTTNDRKVRNT
jgi:hypothetical protein